MAQSISGSLEIRYRQTYNNVLDLETFSSSLDERIQQAFTNGTGANKAQASWTDRRSLLTTTSEEIDLRALTNGFGTLTATKIKALIIRVRTTTPGYRLLVGGAASNAWEAWTTQTGSIIRVGAGSQLVISDWIDGLIVDATHKMLKIENPSGGTVEYDIIVLCEGSVA